MWREVKYENSAPPVAVRGSKTLHAEAPQLFYEGTLDMKWYKPTRRVAPSWLWLFHIQRALVQNNCSLLKTLRHIIDNLKKKGKERNAAFRGNRIIYNYPQKGRWIVVGIYRDEKRRGIYPPLFTNPELCYSPLVAENWSRGTRTKADAGGVAKLLFCSHLSWSWLLPLAQSWSQVHLSYVSKRDGRERTIVAHTTKSLCQAAESLTLSAMYELR